MIIKNAKRPILVLSLIALLISSVVIISFYSLVNNGPLENLCNSSLQQTSFLAESIVSENDSDSSAESIKAENQFDDTTSKEHSDSVNTSISGESGESSEEDTLISNESSVSTEESEDLYKPNEDSSFTPDTSASEASEPETSKVDTSMPNVSEKVENIETCTVSGIISCVTYSTGKTYGTVAVQGDRYNVKNSKSKFELIVPTGENITLIFLPIEGYEVYSIFVNEKRIFVDTLNEYTLTCDSTNIKMRVMLIDVRENCVHGDTPVVVNFNGTEIILESLEEAKTVFSVETLESMEEGGAIAFDDGYALTSNGEGSFATSDGYTLTASQVSNMFNSQWCRDCGKRVGDGTNGTCIYFTRDKDCPLCGEACKKLECHTCAD